MAFGGSFNLLHAGGHTDMLPHTLVYNAASAQQTMASEREQAQAFYCQRALQPRRIA